MTTYICKLRVRLRNDTKNLFILNTLFCKFCQIFDYVGLDQKLKESYFIQSLCLVLLGHLLLLSVCFLHSVLVVNRLAQNSH